MKTAVLNPELAELFSRIRQFDETKQHGIAVSIMMEIDTFNDCYDKPFSAYDQYSLDYAFQQLLSLDDEKQRYMIEAIAGDLTWDNKLAQTPEVLEKLGQLADEDQLAGRLRTCP